MTLLALGINHNTAPVALREQVAFGPDKIQLALTSLCAEPGVSSAVIISTCNRTELYLSVDATMVTNETLRDWLIQFHYLSPTELSNCLYYYQQHQVIHHLMRVASGLDSLILGEPQILGQVKQAFNLAQQTGSMNSEMELLFQKTFSVAKKVRSETAIGSSAVSVAYAACTLARQIFESLSTINVLLIGAGETIELVAKHLREHHVSGLTIANRTRERAENLAKKMAAEVIDIGEIPEALKETDIIISSTASPLPIIGKGMMERALKARRNKPVLIVDIAVPRDVEPEVSQLSAAYLYTVDDLQAIIEHNLAQRHAAASDAEAIVNQECDNFLASLRIVEARDSILDYRNHAMQMSEELQQKALSALASGQDARLVLKELAHKLTNRLIHAPTVSLQQAAKDGDTERLQLLKESFGLE